MIDSIRGLEWYKDDPERFLIKQPFVRGGEGVHFYQSKDDVSITDTTRVQGSKIKYKAITQDVYLSEMNPYLHAVMDMANMPKISVTFRNQWTYEASDIIVASGYQKVIHATQIQHLSHSPMKFNLCELRATNVNNSVDTRTFISKIMDKITKKTPESQLQDDVFADFQTLWDMHNEESMKTDIYSCQKSCGDVAVLFEGNEQNKDQIRRKIYRYKDGYIAIPNYDEYGTQIACTLYYTIDNGDVECMDVYTDLEVYRYEKNIDISRKDNDTPEWILRDDYPKKHGYASIPLLYKRGVVAWEYVQSYITIIELIENVMALCQKYYSTFMIGVFGQVDDHSLESLTGEILSISITNPGDNDRIEAIKFPENTSAYKYLEHCREQLQTFCSTTIGTSKSQTSGSDSRGGAMTMRFKPDIALAKQTHLDYADFWSRYVSLLQTAWDMQYHNNERVFRKLLIKAHPEVWTPISDSLLIDNIQIAREGGFMSRRTAIEKNPMSERDELLRVLEEDEAAFDKEVEKVESSNNNNPNDNDDIKQTE